MGASSGATKNQAAESGSENPKRESEAPRAGAAVLGGDATVATDLEPGAREEWPGARTWSERSAARRG